MQIWYLSYVSQQVRKKMLAFLNFASVLGIRSLVVVVEGRVSLILYHMIAKNTVAMLAGHDRLTRKFMGAFIEGIQEIGSALVRTLVWVTLFWIGHCLQCGIPPGNEFIKLLFSPVKVCTSPNYRKRACREAVM